MGKHHLSVILALFIILFYINIQESHAAGGDTCATAQPISTLPYNDTGNHASGSTNTVSAYGGANWALPQVEGYIGNDRFYTLTLYENNDVSFALQSLRPGDTDYVLILLSECNESPVVVEHSTDVVNDLLRETLNVSGLPAGDYILVVDAWAGSDDYPKYGNYQLSVSGSLGEVDPLTVEAVCVADDLHIDITAGDAPFDIGFDGPGNPPTGVSAGTYTFTGPGIWQDIIVTERGGDGETFTQGLRLCGDVDIDPLVRVNPTDQTTIDQNTTTLEWYAHPESEWYHIYIDSVYGPVEEWVKGDTCDLTCTYALSDLNNGVYHWWLAGYDLDTGGYNTNWLDHDTFFSVRLPDERNIIRAAPVDYAVIDSPVTALVWATTPNTSYYHVYLGGPNGYSFEQWYDAAEVCSAGECRITEAANLQNGRYRWWMAGWDDNTIGPYTETTFTIDAAAAGVLTNPAPADESSTAAGEVDFSWDAASAALWYHLYISGPDGYRLNQWYAAGTVCSAGRCSISLDLTTAGVYSWWVGSWGPAGYGAYNSGPPYDEADDYRVTIE
jgi:hypothetical protein